MRYFIMDESLFDFIEVSNQNNYLQEISHSLELADSSPDIDRAHKKNLTILTDKLNTKCLYKPKQPLLFEDIFNFENDNKYKMLDDDNEQTKSNTNESNHSDDWKQDSKQNLKLDLSRLK